MVCTISFCSDRPQAAVLPSYQQHAQEQMPSEDDPLRREPKHTYRERRSGVLSVLVSAYTDERIRDHANRTVFNPKISSFKADNSDGIDVLSSSNVHVSDCTLDVADDATDVRAGAG